MHYTKTFIWIIAFVSMTVMSYAQSGWSLQNNPLPDSTLLGKIQFVSPTEGWISANKGDLLHTTDAGVTWIRVVPFPDDTVTSPSDMAANMSWVNQTHGWKMNSFGTGVDDAHGAVIHKTTDGGITWEKKVLSTTVGDGGVMLQFVDENNGWALTYNFSSGNGSFLRTTDGGDNWSPSNGGGIFYFVDANNGWAFYGSGVNGSSPPYRIIHTTNGGTDWTEQFSDNMTGGYNAMYFSDLEHGWIVGDSGKVVKTTNGGTNWNYVTNSGINPNDRSKVVFFLDANNGWISTKDGNGYGIIQHTTDGGASWISQGTPLVNPQGGNRIFSIYFVDAQNGWLTDGHRICHYSGTTSVEENDNIPIEFSLFQNYPNPFNPNTTIKFSIPSRQFVTIKVFDLLGREIETLVNEEKSIGNYELKFDGSNLTSGVYFYRLHANNFSETKKLILIK